MNVEIYFNFFTVFSGGVPFQLNMKRNIVYFSDNIFVQLFFNIFLITFSHTHIIFLFLFFSFFFSLYCFGPIKREKIKVIIKIVTNSLINIVTFLYKIGRNNNFFVLTVKEYFQLNFITLILGKINKHLFKNLKKKF